MFSSSSKERVKSKKGRRWRLFHATDFQSLMYPCFIFCRILGIFPYKINTSSFEMSKPCYILSTVIKCVTCFCTLIILYEISISEWFKPKGLRRIIEISAFYIFGSFIIIVTYIWNGPRMRLLQTILNISSRLPLESYQKQAILIHAKDISGFLLLLVQMLTCFNLQIPVSHVVLSFYITLVIFQMDMLYMNCVCVLKTCFKKINDDLENLLVLNKEPHLFRWVYHDEQRNPFFLMELNALKKRHLMVNNTVQMLNMIFSLQLLATVVITFTRITFSLYYCLVLWGDLEYATSSEKLFAFILFITSIAYYFIKIALIAWACETGRDQAVEIGITIHDVSNRISDDQIKNELQLFSLQILHTRKNTFSAKGFAMGAPLLATLTGSITMYLLILIQFMNLSSPCNEQFTFSNTTQITQLNEDT